MRDCGIVQGSKEQAQSLIINKDTVYVHTDITQVTTDLDGNVTDNLYQYHEYQYDLMEYIMKESNVMQSALNGLIMGVK